MKPPQWCLKTALSLVANNGSHLMVKQQSLNVWKSMVITLCFTWSMTSVITFHAFSLPMQRCRNISAHIQIASSNLVTNTRFEIQACSNQFCATAISACLLQSQAAFKTNKNGLPASFWLKYINYCFKDGTYPSSEGRGHTSHQSPSTFATCY